MLYEKRVFKTKTFDRWAKGVLSDDQLCAAAKEVLAGMVETDLGGGICKKRIAVKGGGKSGGTRVLIAKQNLLGLFFLAGRQKSGPGTDFTTDQIEAAKIVGRGLNRADGAHVNVLLAAGTIREICNEGKEIHG